MKNRLVLNRGGGRQVVGSTHEKAMTPEVFKDKIHPATFNSAGVFPR